MSFPKVAYDNAPAALSGMMNAASTNGLSDIVGKGFEATRDALIANMTLGVPGANPPISFGPGTIGVGGFRKQSVTRRGELIVTELLIDLTGLASVATDLDIIGLAAAAPASYLGQVTADINGTIIGGSMKCLEVPAGGAIDIDLYAATEATGAYDIGVGTLTETIVVTSGGNWTIGRELGISPDSVAANQYLYLTSGAATAGTFTAGRFLITLIGY